MALLSIEQRINKYKDELARPATQKESQYNRWTRHLFVKQNGLCPICKCDLNPDGRHPPVLDIRSDNNNAKPFGLLCVKCEVIVRYSNYDEVLIDRAREYLNKKDENV